MKICLKISRVISSAVIRRKSELNAKTKEELKWRHRGMSRRGFSRFFKAGINLHISVSNSIQGSTSECLGFNFAMFFIVMLSHLASAGSIFVVYRFSSICKLRILPIKSFRYFISRDVINFWVECINRCLLKRNVNFLTKSSSQSFV